MLEGISGTVALVTGAARPRSIGRATARRLAREGAHVAVLDIARPYSDFPDHGVANADDLAATVVELEALGVRSVGVRADVTDWDEVHAAVAEAAAALGPIDTVVNVAGGDGAGLAGGPILGMSAEAFRKVVDVNLTGTFIVTRAVVERMVADGRGGCVVNTSSQAGKVGWPMLAAYGPAKAGVINLTQVMAQEWATLGIRANAVCPGTVDTDLLNKDGGFVEIMGALDPGGWEAWLSREIPLGRLQQPEEVADAIAFLCSHDARYITGEALNVSGGQMMA